MDRMSHKYRAWTERKSRRPAEDLLLNRSRGVEIACDFACREYISGKSVFCTLFHARKSVWPPGIGQRGAAGYRQTYLCASMRRKDFPHDNTRVPRRTPFWPKPEKIKGALLREGTFRAMRETPTGTASWRFLLRFGSPAPGDYALRRPATAPNWLGENLFFLMRRRAGDEFFR